MSSWVLTVLSRGYSVLLQDTTQCLFVHYTHTYKQNGYLWFWLALFRSYQAAQVQTHILAYKRIRDNLKKL